MAKIHPKTPSFSPESNQTREVFTIWMKSLVFHSYGCTVFDSSGEIVYRVENYTKKCSNEVYLMDLRGRVLVTIRRKKLGLFGRWDCYIWGYTNKVKPWFSVKKCCRILMGDVVCQAFDGCNKYCLEELAGKAAFKIADTNKNIVAEVKQKQSSSGYSLGEDVLTLVVEPHVDHRLIMSIVTVYALINKKM
ncbi:Tub_2 domain-containing protein [Cephalotus follicularis]|uniref:Tub_2 domain-containing protein n=1 Tax=Cephalotus follicularis TaxID=3775 RepID=A0A1Q3AQC0_CEPFO|nr:Tub_2 domain-containing protein [Cephalotus follicularis]